MERERWHESCSGRTRFMSSRVIALAVGLVLAIARSAAAAPPEAARARALLADPAALSRWLEKRSSEVGAARAQVEQSRAEARAARLLPNPVADFSVSNFSVGETTPRGLGPGRTLAFDAGISELIELGKRGPRAAAADLRVQAAQKLATATLSQRVSEARLALGRAIYARERHKVLAASLSAAEESAAVAQRRLEHQALSGVDYDRVLLDVASLASEVRRSRAESEAALATCSAALLAACDLADADVSALDAVPLPSPAADDVAKRADIAALRLQVDASRADATLAARRAVPDLTFRLGYTHDRFPGNNANTLALSVALPIPLFDRGQHERARALAAADELGRSARALAELSRGAIAALEARRRAAERNLESLRKETLAKARSVLVAQERGLGLGETDVTDLLLARRHVIALELSSLDLRFELFELRSELRRLRGVDDQPATNKE